MVRHRLVWLGLVAVTVLVVAGCTTWANQSVPSGTGPLFGISCPSTTNCVAVSTNAILTTTNGGSSWSSQPLPAGATLAGGRGAPGVSCPATTDCVAVGGGTILTSSDGGSTWVSQPVPSGVVDLTSVSCPSVTHCVAVGGTINVTPVSNNSTGDIVTTNDGGITWVKALPAGTGPPPLPIFSVSCASTTVCVTVGLGGSVLTTTDGGTTWINQTGDPGMLLIGSVSCSSISTCEAGGSVTGPPNATASLIATTDGGTTWVSQTPPSPPPGLITGISCASTTSCVAVGGNTGPSSEALGNVGIITTTDGGATWTSETVPSGVAGLMAVSCPSPTSCVAVGENQQGDGAIVRTG